MYSQERRPSRQKPPRVSLALMLTDNVRKDRKRKVSLYMLRI
jgi:hypothetical protein